VTNAKTISAVEEKKKNKMQIPRREDLMKIDITKYKQPRQGGTARANRRMLSTNPLIRSSYWFFGSPAMAS
jgi:hypothetical protein